MSRESGLRSHKLPFVLVREKKKKGKKIPQNSTSTGEGAASTVYLLSSGLKSHLKNALYCVYERYLFYKNTNNKNKLQCVCVCTCARQILLWALRVLWDLTVLAHGVPLTRLELDETRTAHSPTSHTPSSPISSLAFAISACQSYLQAPPFFLLI